MLVYKKQHKASIENMQTRKRSTQTHVPVIASMFPATHRRLALDYQSPVIIIMGILTGQTKTLDTRHGTSGCTPLTYITTIPMGFEAEVFIGLMPFVALNKQYQSTDGIEKALLSLIKQQPHIIIISMLCQTIRGMALTKACLGGLVG